MQDPADEFAQLADEIARRLTATGMTVAAVGIEDGQPFCRDRDALGHRLRRRWGGLG